MERTVENGSPPPSEVKQRNLETNQARRMTPTRLILVKNVFYINVSTDGAYLRRRKIRASPASPSKAVVEGSGTVVTSR